MLRSLHLEKVGPADDLRLSPIAKRFNLITGDNGLGKSFLLDIAWWVLTRTWHETPAIPNAKNAAIKFVFDRSQGVTRGTSKWSVRGQYWPRTPGRPPNPGLVLYARVDGSFSVWDPARNYRLYTRKDGGQAESPGAYQFTPAEVLEGLTREVHEAGIPRTQVLCRGLIDDWTRWQASGKARFALLKRFLRHIGPGEEPLRPGKPIRPTLDDEREIPTIRMAYGLDVPITYAPAGVRRMAKLAYLLAWTFSEHRKECARLDPSRQVIVLVDEPETHLHPRWQRTVLPSLLHAVQGGRADSPDVQLLVATHSPLVLASMEPTFDASLDALWKLDLREAEVVIERDEWHARGDVNRWLESDVFDLGSATSTQAEAALRRAARLLALKRPRTNEVRRADAELAGLLPAMDPFFIRWRHYMARHLDLEAGE